MTPPPESHQADKETKYNFINHQNSNAGLGEGSNSFKTYIFIHTCINAIKRKFLFQKSGGGVYLDPTPPGHDGTCLIITN